MSSYIYSDSLDTMVVRGFTIHWKKYGDEHYTWSDDDCLYWSDDRDDYCYADVPEKADIDK